MSSIENNLHYWSKYDWSQRGHEWSEAWGGTDNLWTFVIEPRIARFAFPNYPWTVLEIGCGYGRWINKFLVDSFCKYGGVDVTPACVKHCADTYGHYLNSKPVPMVSIRLCDGKTLDVEDVSIDFVFSWDSLVHCEWDVVSSYLGEVARALKPGGAAFLHHSNGKPGGGRAISVSAAVVREWCARRDIPCYQEIIPWGTTEDCFTLFGGAVKENRSWKNIGFMQEAAMIKARHEFWR